MNAVKIDVSVVCIAAANHHALNARAEMNCSFACIPFLPTACRRERNTVISVSVDIQFTFRRSINSSGIDKGELIVSRLRNKEVHRNGVSSFTIRINKARSRVSTMIIVRGYIRKNRILRLDSIRQGIVVITDIVDDSMDLSYSLASIAGLRSLPLFTSNELYSYALLNEYQQQLIEFEKANRKVLSDFASSNDTTLHADIDQLCSLVPHKDSAALWETGCYIIQSITDRYLIEDALLTSAWKELTGFCTSCAGGVSDANFSHAVYQSVVCLLEKEQTITQDTMPVIKMAKEYITQHFCESISLSEVADYCNVNSSYLSNLFHKQLGISYSKYLMQIRMERAAAYLKDSPETKIYEIGEKLGFVSTKHFISVFKKYYGVSPTTYQKEQCGS